MTTPTPLEPEKQLPDGYVGTVRHDEPSEGYTPYYGESPMPTPITDEAIWKDHSGEHVRAEVSRKLEIELDAAEKAKVRASEIISHTASLLIESETQLTAANARAEKAIEALERAGVDAKHWQDKAEDLQRQLGNIKASAIHSCGPECTMPICVLRREKKEALSIARELAKFVRHEEACVSNNKYSFRKECSCGLPEALQRLEKMEAKQG